MPTDTERREVAERLRYEADYPGYAVQYMEQFIGDLRQVLFGDLNPTADYSEMFARLADLIEPSCDASATHTDATATRDVSQCRRSDVDRDALLALASGLEADADRIVRAARNARFGGGPRMGEAKHEASEWRSIARRIREACGMVDAD